MQPSRVLSNASPSASLAAAQAFVKDRESNPNLSNAAAAAALRSNHTPLPPVGDTITKRMMRRGSQSSNSSAPAGLQQRGGLQRKSSSGSMTERTFRTPSPGRGEPASPNAPPVPAMPARIPGSGSGHRRASSLEPRMRGASPNTRGTASGRGVSLDRGAGPTTGGGRGQRATSNLQQVIEDDQDPDAGNRSSVNFSRPMSPASAARANAAPQSGWFGGPKVNVEAVQRMASTSRPSTSSGLVSADVQRTQQAVRNAANQPVKTHQIAHGVQGAQLSSGSMRAKPSGMAVESRSYLPASKPVAVDPKSPDAVFDPSTRTFVHKQTAMALHREMHEEPEVPSHRYVAQHVQDHYSSPSTPRQPPPRTPSPVRQPTRAEVPLPRIDTSARIRRPEDPPTGIPSSGARADAALEDAQLEQGNASGAYQPTPIDIMVSPKAPNQDSAYPRLATPAAPSTTNTPTGQGRGGARVQHDRGNSLSPGRNAHFAPVAVELSGVKHQPPARSISPAKSALKSSPSVSRPASQNGRLNTRGAPSETSSTTSDGGSGKKKKSVRVSFEETPVITATPSKTEVEETPTSPTGLGGSRWSPREEKDNEFDDFMKPRPALPSFGSVREKERRPPADEAEKVTETVSSSPMTSSVGSVGQPLATSSDHALAGIISHDFAKDQTATKPPVPPEVTSVEGSGYVSDSDAEDATTSKKHGALDDSSQILPVPEPKSLTAPHEEKLSTPASITEQAVQVPDIALQPATPNEQEEPKYQSMIPGGWGDDDVPDSKRTSASGPPTTLHELVTRDEESSEDDDNSIYSDAYEDISDVEGYGSIDAVANSPVASKSTGLMSSKYADKGTTEPSSSGLRNETMPEEASSPVQTHTEDWNAASQHWSGINEARKQSPQNTFPTDRTLAAENTAASAVAIPSKQQAPTEDKTNSSPTSSPNTPAQKKATSPQARTPQSTQKPLKSALKKSPEPPAAAIAPAQPHIRKTMRGPPPLQAERAPPPPMRTSMRGPSGGGPRSAEPQMRSTMRSGRTSPSPRDQPQMRSSMRPASPVANSAGLAASRHSIPPAEQKPPRGALQKRHIPANVQAANARPLSMPAAAAKPVPAYESDSDASASSFQKARGKRATSRGGRSMRSSMRQEAAPTMRTTAPAPKHIRAISPPGSPSPAMRKSLRPSSPTPEAPKSSRFSIRSLSPMGRFRQAKPIEAAPAPRQVSGLSKQSKPSKQKAPAPQRAKPAFSSRFADSSDEDEDAPRPSRFTSRFATDTDSDDDEPVDYKLPPGLTPVRGIPRKAGEEDGDSTDLEEEADTPIPTPAVEKETGTTNGTSNNQGAALATGSLRDSKHAPTPLPSFEGGGKTKSKRGFFGLGRKKAQPTTAVPAPAPAPAPTNPTSPLEIPMPPTQHNRNPSGPLTPIDEDKDFTTPPTSPTNKQKSPKLQRRSTPEWPLPPPIPMDDEIRPMSSDGISPRRPRFATRQPSTMSNATAPGEMSGRSVSYGRTGKKKKFQGLRRAFGLND